MPSAITNAIKIHSARDFRYICRVNNNFSYDREIDGGYEFFKQWLSSGLIYRRDGCEDEMTYVSFETKKLEVKCLLYLAKMLNLEQINETYIISEEGSTIFLANEYLQYRTLEERFTVINEPHNGKFIYHEDEFVFKKLKMEIYSAVFPWNL